MSTFEEEALRRARQMQNKVNNIYPQENKNLKANFDKNNKHENSSKKNVEEIAENIPSENQIENIQSVKGNGTLDFLLADKEQSLILLLLLLLTGENADPSLLLALMYILI